jgi:predicted ATPase/transcriptional regulator with XRE-family HTH domain
MASPSAILPHTAATTFGDYLKYLRRRARLTQREVAIAVGYSEMQISRLEHNQRRPDLATLMALFVPALGLEDEPDCVDRLLELAAVARGGPPPAADAAGAWPAPQAALKPKERHSSPHHDRGSAAKGTAKIDGSSRPRRVSLPVPPTPLVGRLHEVAEVRRRLLRDDIRLLTLTGPPGIGKTRLALRVAQDLEDMFSDGVAFVTLAPVTDPGLVVSAIAQTLGVQEQADQGLLDGVKQFVQERELLLVLDNFEQVLEAAPVVGALLAAARRLKALATSRAALQIYGEHTYVAPPLGLPELTRLPHTAAKRVAALTEAEAVQLFLARTQAANPAFAITDTNAAAVALICHRLEGLPMAIELAAARGQLLSPQALLLRLSSRLNVLTGGPRDHPPRQQTLRGAIEWSYNLLDADEQALFRRLGIFAGGFTLVATEAVMPPCTPAPLPPLVDLLQSLLNKSLIQRQAAGNAEPDDEPRFTMLETLGEYALLQLTAHGETNSVRRQHAMYFLRLAEAVEQGLTGPEPILWLERQEVDHDNVRAALVWCYEHDIPLGLRLATALWTFWGARGYFAEGRRWLERMLVAAGAWPMDRADKEQPAAGAATHAATTAAMARLPSSREGPLPIPGDIVAKALLGAGSLAVQQSEHVTGRTLIEASLNLSREIGDKAGIALAIQRLGWAAGYQGAYDQMQARLEESLSLLREVGDKPGIAWTLSNLASLHRQQAEYARARVLFEESLVIVRKIGFRREMSWLLGNLGNLARLEGDYPRARELCEESLRLFRETQDKPGMTWTLSMLGNLARIEGNFQASAARLAESLALAHELEVVRYIAVGLCFAGILMIEQERCANGVRLVAAAIVLNPLLKTGAALDRDEQADLDQRLAAARATLGEEDYAEAWASGTHLGLSQAVDVAQTDLLA